MANILYFGVDFSGSTAGQRANAIKRLGHNVDIRDPYKAFGKTLESWMGHLHFRTGYRFMQGAIVKYLNGVIQTLPFKPDLIWVDMGELFGPSALSALRKANCPIVCYNVDDPTGPRDGNRFRSFIKSIPLYDIIAVVRKETAKECEALGGKRVVHVFRSYDEEIHKPYPSVDDIPSEFRSDVVFIGTWMRYEKRDEFMLKLVERGVPLTIWGDRWQKSPHFEKLKSHWKGKALYGREYVAAIQGSKICLGMLSKGNRDLHTTRSLEVPFAGGLFCCERTSEHEELYRENVEAVFWSDADECATKCIELLSDECRMENIREAGMSRVRALKLGNEDVCNQILSMVLPELVKK
ncbi:MAG: glycosyltransferase [Chryseolinea sp.]